MSRRRRSLLGNKKRKPGTVLPAGPRQSGPPKEEPPADEAAQAAAEAPPDPEAFDEPDTVTDEPETVADEAEAEAGADRPEGAEDEVAVVEDDAPMIGSDLDVPPAQEGEDQHEAPQEVVAHLHTRPPEAEEGAPTAPPPSDEDLVLFDERPDEPAEDADPLVTIDEDGPALSDQPDAAALMDTGPPSDDAAPPEASSEAEGSEAAPPAAPGQSDFTPDEESFFSHEDGDPPTEEAPAGMLAEDFASLYSAPTDVPDAPLMPEILGADTPAPAGGGGYRPVRAPSAPPAPEVTSPKGLWDETPHPNAGRTPPPESGDATAPSKGKGATPPPPVYRQREAAGPAEEELPFWKDTWFLVAIAFAVVAAVIVLIFFFFFAGPLSGAPPAQTAPMRSRPVAPDVSPPPVDLVPRDADGALAPDDEQGATESDEPETPLVEPRTPPAEEPPPRTRSTTPSTTGSGTSDPAPVARTGRLKIRATRRTLIYVNNKPVGLTPLDLDREAGKYEISAEVDGQKQVRKVDLTSGTIRLVEF